jgi:hypothetical protein
LRGHDPHRQAVAQMTFPERPMVDANPHWLALK